MKFIPVDVDLHMLIRKVVPHFGITLRELLRLNSGQSICCNAADVMLAPS